LAEEVKKKKRSGQSEKKKKKKNGKFWEFVVQRLSDSKPPPFLLRTPTSIFSTTSTSLSLPWIFAKKKKRIQECVCILSRDLQKI